MSNRTGRGGFRPKTTKKKVAAVADLLGVTVIDSLTASADYRQLQEDKQRYVQTVGRGLRPARFGGYLDSADEAPDAGLRRYLNRGRFNAKNPA